MTKVYAQARAWYIPALQWRWGVLVIGIASGTYVLIQRPAKDVAQAGEGREDVRTTFEMELLPILQKHCTECHNSNTAGVNLSGAGPPMSLESYEEVRLWGSRIAQAVLSRRMPPWHAAARHRGTFVGERYLDDDEIQTLVDWARQDTVDGRSYIVAEDVARVPEVHQKRQWAIGTPDLTLNVPVQYSIPTHRSDHYANFDVIVPDFGGRVLWMKGAEILPGNSYVHHVIVPGVTGFAPGRTPALLPRGFGRPLKGGTAIEFQMHYNVRGANADVVTDSTQLGIYLYQPGETVAHVVSVEPLEIVDILVPPHSDQHSRSKEFVFPVDALIVSVSPHMHLRGSRATYEILLPGLRGLLPGGRKLLLEVPSYDFNWQHLYLFREPVAAPRGSTLRFTAFWNNAATNPSNPDPSVFVGRGQETDQEMGVGWLSWAAAEPENVVVQ